MRRTALSNVRAKGKDGAVFVHTQYTDTQKHKYNTNNTFDLAWPLSLQLDNVLTADPYPST
jgi:hypothetical protein